LKLLSKTFRKCTVEKFGSKRIEALWISISIIYRTNAVDNCIIGVQKFARNRNL